MLRSLVGSEMCIRDRPPPLPTDERRPLRRSSKPGPPPIEGAASQADAHGAGAAITGAALHPQSPAGAPQLPPIDERRPWILSISPSPPPHPQDGAAMIAGAGAGASQPQPLPIDERRPFIWSSKPSPPPKDGAASQPHDSTAGAAQPHDSAAAPHPPPQPTRESRSLILSRIPSPPPPQPHESTAPHPDKIFPPQPVSQPELQGLALSQTLQPAFESIRSSN